MFSNFFGIPLPTVGEAISFSILFSVQNTASSRLTNTILGKLIFFQLTCLWFLLFKTSKVTALS